MRYAHRATPEPRRPRRVQVKLTDAEYAELVRRVAASDAHSLAEYFRQAALARRIGARPPAPPAVNVELSGELGRLSGTLNQIAHHLNQGHIYQGGGRAAALEGTLAEVQRILGETRRQLLAVER